VSAVVRSIQRTAFEAIFHRYGSNQVASIAKWEGQLQHLVNVYDQEASRSSSLTSLMAALSAYTVLSCHSRAKSLIHRASRHAIGIQRDLLPRLNLDDFISDAEMHLVRAVFSPSIAALLSKRTSRSTKGYNGGQSLYTAI
jgi:hypothetical protein